MRTAPAYDACVINYVYDTAGVRTVMAGKWQCELSAKGYSLNAAICSDTPSR
jgi:hypothetical protein